MTTRKPSVGTATLAAVALLTGCLSMDVAVPPVAALVPDADGARRTELERGRTIYLTDCARCHSPEPVRRYSPTRWAEILEEMLGETRIDGPGSAALRAYITTVLAQAPTAPPLRRDPPMAR